MPFQFLGRWNRSAIWHTLPIFSCDTFSSVFLNILNNMTRYLFLFIKDFRMTWIKNLTRIGLTTTATTIVRTGRSNNLHVFISTFTLFRNGFYPFPFQWLILIIYDNNRQTSGESALLPQSLGCNTVFDMRLRVTFLRRKTVSLQSNIAHGE